MYYTAQLDWRNAGIIFSEVRNSVHSSIKDNGLKFKKPNGWQRHLIILTKYIYTLLGESREFKGLQENFTLINFTRLN